MELNKIQSSGSWGKVADDLNQNFSKVNNAVEQVKNATTRNKGYFSSDTELKSAFPSANVGDIAYVGSAYPYQTWEWDGSAWKKKNDAGGEESVNLGDYYTKEETDEKFTEADAKLSELGQKVITINSELYGKGGINDISSLLVWSEGYQILAAGGADLFGTAQQLSSGKRDASDYYELGDATSIVTTLIHPASTISNGGLVFYDSNKVAISGGGHYLNSNTADAYTEVEITIPSKAKFFRTTRWNAIAGVSGEFKCELRTPNSEDAGLLGRVGMAERKIENLESNSEELSTEVKEIRTILDGGGGEQSEEVVDLSSLPSVGLQLNSDLAWSQTTDATGYTLYKELDMSYSRVSVKANDNNAARVFFTEKELPRNATKLVSGDGYLCDYSNPFQNIEAGAELEFSVPSNAKYMYIWKSSTGNVNRVPQSVVMYTGSSGSGLVGEVENLKNDISELQESNDNQNEEIATLNKAINGEAVYNINDISSSLVWSEGYQILAAGSTDLFGTAQQLSSGKRDASDYYELGDATSIVTTLIHPASTISNGGLVFYDSNKVAIFGEGHYLNSNTADAYTEVEIAIPSNAKYFRTTRWNAIAGVSGEFKCELKTLVGQVSEGIIGRLNKLEGLGINPIVGSPKIYQSGATDFGNINDLTVGQVYELYDDLVSLHPNYFFKREDLGTDSSGLYQLRHYTLRMGNPYVSSTYTPNDPSTNVWDDNTMSPRTICIVAGVHGNEKTSIYGVYLSIKEILESVEEWATFIRANFVLEICPIVNCWGVDNNSRPNFNGANINRDFLEESPQEETILVKNLIKGCHNLHAVLDSHNSTYVTGVGSVNLGYLPTNNTFRFHNYYCQVAAKLASALYPRMKELFNRSTQKPYIVAWISGNSGTLMDYVNNELNLIGGTLEAPNCDFGISDATLNNNSRWCEVTKDLLINTIQLYGCQEYPL